MQKKLKNLWNRCSSLQDWTLDRHVNHIIFTDTPDNQRRLAWSLLVTEHLKSNNVVVWKPWLKQSCTFPHSESLDMFSLCNWMCRTGHSWTSIRQIVCNAATNEHHDDEWVDSELKWIDRFIMPRQYFDISPKLLTSQVFDQMCTGNALSQIILPQNTHDMNNFDIQYNTPLTEELADKMSVMYGIKISSKLYMYPRAHGTVTVTRETIGTLFGCLFEGVSTELVCEENDLWNELVRVPNLPYLNKKEITMEVNKILGCQH